MCPFFHRAFSSSFLALLIAAPFSSSLTNAAEPRDPARLSTELCVGCHGPNLSGGPGPSLLDNEWKNGSDDASILRSIRNGNPQATMPPFATVITEEEQGALLGYIR